MPRETVAAAVDPFHIPYDGEGQPTADRGDPWRVEVGWMRDSDVQIATVDPNHPDSTSREAGLWVTLDRKGVNDLIRYLRRARDQAFGRDE